MSCAVAVGCLLTDDYKCVWQGWNKTAARLKKELVALDSPVSASKDGSASRLREMPQVSGRLLLLTNFIPGTYRQEAIY